MLTAALDSYPNTSIWITEYNLNDQDLPTTEAFYNISAEYFDRLAYVERYSLFGAFRSDVSNVGPNAAMLSASGQLTDIGAWYLGRPETGVNPGTKNLGVRGADPRLGLSLATVLVTAFVLLGF